VTSRRGRLSLQRAGGVTSVRGRRSPRGGFAPTRRPGSPRGHDNDQARSIPGHGGGRQLGPPNSPEHPVCNRAGPGAPSAESRFHRLRASRHSTRPEKPAALAGFGSARGHQGGGATVWSKKLGAGGDPVSTAEHHPQRLGRTPRPRLVSRGYRARTVPPPDDHRITAGDAAVTHTGAPRGTVIGLWPLGSGRCVHSTLIAHLSGPRGRPLRTRCAEGRVSAAALRSAGTAFNHLQFQRPRNWAEACARPIQGIRIGIATTTRQMPAAITASLQGVRPVWQQGSTAHHQGAPQGGVHPPGTRATQPRAWGAPALAVGKPSPTKARASAAAPPHHQRIGALVRPSPSAASCRGAVQSQRCQDAHPVALRSISP